MLSIFKPFGSTEIALACTMDVICEDYVFDMLSVLQCLCNVSQLNDAAMDVDSSAGSMSVLECGLREYKQDPPSTVKLRVAPSFEVQNMTIVPGQ